MAAKTANGKKNGRNRDKIDSRKAKYWRYLQETQPIPKEVWGVEHWCNTVDLGRRRCELEDIIEPYVTTKATSRRCIFKGEPRYLRVSQGSTAGDLVYLAEIALHALDNLEAAILASDIEQVVDSTYAFARHEFAVEIFSKCGCGPEELVGIYGMEGMIAAQHRNNRGKTAKETRGKSKLQKHDERIKSLYVEKYRGQYKWNSNMRAELADEGIIVGPDTLRERLKLLGVYRK